MLTVIQGPFHPELEEAFFEKVRALKKRNPLASLLIVTPTRVLAHYLAETLAGAFPDGIAALSFHTPTSLARKIDDEFPESRLHVLDDPVVLERLVLQIIAQEFSNRPYLRHALQVPGTARAILKALYELRAGGVDSADALEAIRDGIIGSGDATPKITELLSLHYCYARELRDRGWRDSCDLMRRSVELASHSRLLATQDAIVYYGFDHAPQLELDLFHRISRTFPTLLFCPYQPRPEYTRTQEFLETILADERSVLEPSVFSVSPRPRILSASGTQDEVWAAAKEILRLHDAGIPFSQIAVIGRSLEPYLDFVETIFGENRIPFSACVETPALLRREIDLLRVSDAGFPRDLVIPLVSSAAPDQRALWDLLTRKLGIGRGRAEWEKRLFPLEGKDYLHKEGERFERTTLTVSAESITELILAVRDLFVRCTGLEEGSWSEQTAWARSLMGDRPEIDSLAALDGVAPPPSGRDFRQLLCESLQRATRPAGAPNAQGVQVLDAPNAQGLRFRAVLLLGLNEHVWPRATVEDPLLPQAVRQELRFRLGCTLPPLASTPHTERLLFDLASAAAREELIILWQRSDEKGREQVRSPFIAEEEITVPRRPIARLASTPSGHLTPKELALRTILNRSDISDAARAFGWDVASFTTSTEHLHAIENGRVAGVHDGVVGRVEPFWSGLRARGVSPTSLEALVTCPFQYFVHKVLRLEPLEEPEAEKEFSGLETGQLYHDFLERFYRAYGDRPLPKSLAEARDVFERCLAETVRDFEETRTMRYPLLWEAEQARMRQVLKAFLERDLTRGDGFAPTFFEERVEGTLDLPLGPYHDMKFMGFIDRLDVHPSGAFRVIDYKSARTSRYSTGMSRGLATGRYLQPPIYYLLAQELLRRRGRKVVPESSQSGYFFLREYATGEDEPELWLEGGAWSEREVFGGVLERYLDAIASGFFVLREGSHCQWCDFASICRRTHAPTRRRARRALARFDGEESLHA